MVPLVEDLESKLTVARQGRKSAARMKSKGQLLPREGIGDNELHIS